MNGAGWDKMKLFMFFWWDCAGCSLCFLNALLGGLVVLLVRVVIRVFTVDLARVAFALNAVVVGVLRTAGEIPIKKPSFSHREKNLRILTVERSLIAVARIVVGAR